MTDHDKGLSNASKPDVLRPAQWASILFEPLLGSKERLAIALAAVDETPACELLPMINAKTAKTHFSGNGRYVQEVAALAIESCRAHLLSGKPLADWEPPLQGLFLGEVQEVGAHSLDELLQLAAPISSFMYRDPLPTERSARHKPRTQWSEQVRDIILQSNDRYKSNFNVRIYLGNYDGPAVFTFLTRSFAANLIHLVGKDLKRCIEDARAKLWALNLLADAPSYLFKPEVRELLTGVDPEEDDPKAALIGEAAEALSDEAQRRGINVVKVPTPEAAARHILSQALPA